MNAFTIFHIQMSVKNIAMIKSDLLYLTPLSEEALDLFKEIYTDPNLMELVGDPLTKITAVTLFKAAIRELNESTPKYIFYVIKNALPLKLNNTSF